MIQALVELSCGGFVLPVFLLAIFMIWINKKPEQILWIRTSLAGSFIAISGIWMIFIIWYINAFIKYGGDLNIMVEVAVEAPWSWAFTMFFFASAILLLGLPMVFVYTFFKKPEPNKE